MEYSKEQVASMPYLTWMETIAKELNEAGFKSDKKLSTPYSVSEDNVTYFFMGAINDPNAMKYLKRIGLVNNGRCPMCGEKIKGSPSNFVDNLHPGLDFHICSYCSIDGQSFSVQ